MPSIADSTIKLDNNTIAANPGTGVVSSVAAPIAILAPVRGILPPNQVLAPVTVKAVGGNGTNLLWQVTPPTAAKAAGSPITGGSTIKGTAPTAPPAGIPAQVYGLLATQAPYKTPGGIMESLVSVSYHHWAGDPYFYGVQVWFSGYNGVQQPQLMASAAGEDPIDFTCNATGETVTVTVVAYGSSGLTATFSDAPSTTVTLSGVVNAPPPPTIAQPVTAISGGWQFQWNVLSGLLEDEISGYWVYKSAADSTPTPPLNRVNFVPQPASNIGVLTYQDIDASTEYFWVSAVNTSGLESVLAAANVTTISNTYYPSADSGGYTNPNNAFDGNQATAANFSGLTVAGNGNFSQSEVWSAIPTYIGTAASVTLQILSSVLITSSVATDTTIPGDPNASLLYSVDGGTTWTYIYSVNVSRASQYDYVTLSASQDLTQVQIKASASGISISTTIGHGATEITQTSRCSVNHSIFEISVAVSQNET